MGFRTLAIQQRSSEVWKVLGTVKSEFGKFAEVLANTKRQLQTVANTIRSDGLPHARDPAALLRSMEGARHGEVGVRQVRRGAGEHQAAAADRGQHHQIGWASARSRSSSAPPKYGRCSAR